MAEKIWVVTCPENHQVVRNNGNLKCDYPRNEQIIEISNPNDLVQPFDPTAYGVTFAASFTLLSIFYVTGMGVRAILRMIK